MHKLFGHENLNVYQYSLEYMSWVFDISPKMKGDLQYARSQLIRAAQSIPLNIAEGNGKATPADRRKFFEIARASALECAAIQDVLEVGGFLTKEENTLTKLKLKSIVAMLTKLGGRGFSVNEEERSYGK